jgi:hypothetical protein
MENQAPNPGQPASPQDQQPETDDIKFLEFAKRNFAFLATIAAIPLLSEALGVLSWPDDKIKLNLLRRTKENNWSTQ